MSSTSSEYIPVNGFIAMIRLTDAEKMSDSDLEFSDDESSKMMVHKGEIILIDPEIHKVSGREDIKPGWICRYNRGMAFEMRLDDGIEYTMVNIRDVVMFNPPV